MASIRLKEHPRGQVREHVPADEYRRLCDESLESGPFVQRGTDDGFLHTGNRPEASAAPLVMVGGSFVESLFVHETDRFASIVERSVLPEWRVLNGGYSGMTTLHMLSLLTAKLPPVLAAGGKLLIFVGQSDADSIKTAGGYWDSSRRISPLLPAPSGVSIPWGWEEVLERTVEATLAVADAFGIDYAVVASPFREGDFANDPVLRAAYKRRRPMFEAATVTRQRIQAVARDAAARHGAPFFDGQAAVSQPEHFYDILHLNRSGQHVFAEALTAWLRPWLTGVRGETPAGDRAAV